MGRFQVILCDFYHDLIMGRIYHLIYVTCKQCKVIPVIPVFTLVTTWEDLIYMQELELA